MLNLKLNNQLTKTYLHYLLWRQKDNQIVEKSKTIKVDGDKNKLFLTGLGSMVNSFLVKEFIDLLDYGFTAKVETLLDEIAQGKKVWFKVVASVYDKITPVIDDFL